ncbi:MAG: 3'(2'),5'-bisphosphate nucleotidase CysQ [Methylobacterium sp.]|uniref:3'(2'),5'-bisphosphate nucleotidase CysQ n=1 Tax=Methylobacterium sp. TaxID=409 RepID=UPI0027221287|nr:3'(2'),5'-bisphosphate nucleotidase CysQ [Methylobacterium sp.]MDO9429198.1 3'(2'),5'-bisphosphate nucleotidase CysQ [Methylobacterium sp.]
MPLDTLARTLVRIAIAAGGPVAAAYAHGCATRWKVDGSPVTDADLAAERLILERLAAAFPGIPVVAEESVAAGHRSELGPRFLLVDPLDGTREFIAQRNEFTVNVAMIEDGSPIAGAIYAPLLGQAWFGGTSSYTVPAPPGSEAADLTGARRIGVRAPPDAGLVALVSRSHADPMTEAYLSRLPLAESRPMGSSLKFCRIAEGMADVYPRLGGIREWDIAAGHAILQAAGGTMTALDGEPLRYGDPDRDFRLHGFLASGGFRLPPSDPSVAA